MTPKALVVEDDPQAIDMIVEVLDSLGHEFDTACSQVEAVKRATDNGYSYILLDLEIPARSRTGTPRIQNAENFVERLIQAEGEGVPPVVVMTDRSAGDVDLTLQMMRLAASLVRKGVTDFIQKPFPHAGRTLDRVIKKVLAGKIEPVRITWPTAKARSDVTSASGFGPAVDEDTKPCDPDPRWASVPNEPVTLDEFMAKFCESRSKQHRVYRKRALLAAARHETITLPPLAVPRKPGQANRYFAHDLLGAWQGFLDEGVDLPQLLDRSPRAKLVER